MKFPFRHAILLLPLVAATASALAADEKPDAATVEEIYRGEFDDTGPQYLLKPAAKRAARGTVWARTDVSWTDNALFAEDRPQDTNIASLQLGADLRVTERPLAGGTFTLGAGGRGQTFRYGLAGGDDRVIDTLQVDRNNFDLLGAQVRAAWRRDPWLVTSSIQGTLLHNRSAGRTFYRELAWDAALYRVWNPTGRASLLVGADLARRWTETDTYGLLPRGWNDRAEAGLAAIWQQPIRGRLSWRATARAVIADYTHADRSRRDATGTLSAELSYAWREWCDLRIFLTHERRDSTEPAIHDYSRWEAGAGAGLRWEF